MRITFALFDFIILASIAYIVLTQIAIPAFRGTKLFPMFRREHKLREELFDVNQSVHEDELSHVVHDAREHLAARRDRAATERAAQAAASAAASPLSPMASATAAIAAAGPARGLQTASNDGSDPPESWGAVQMASAASPYLYAIFDFNGKSSLVTLASLNEFAGMTYTSIDLDDTLQQNALLHILASQHPYTAKELEKISDMSETVLKSHFQLFH